MPRSRTCPPAMPISAVGSMARSPFKNLQGKEKIAPWFRMEAGTDTGVTHIYIFDQIGGWFGTNAQDFVDELQNVSTPKIHLHLNTPGGAVFDGVAIYNALRSHPATVDVTVEALAASAGSFIAQAGDTVTMARGSMMMIHDGSGFTLGNQEDHLKMADLLGKISDNVSEIYAKRAGGTAAVWRAAMQAETWYTAKEAVDANLADEVGDEDATEDPNDHWDLSIFNYAGRSKAPDPKVIMNQILKEASVATDPTKTLNTDEAAAADKAAADKEAADKEVADKAAADKEAAAKAAADKAAAESQVENKAGVVFMIDGKQVTDPAAVQAHIVSLEGFRKETSESNRNAFCDQLAKDNKLLASKLAETKKFALSLTPEVYTAWTAIWEGVAANPMFQTQAGGQGDNGAPAGGKLQDEIEVAKGIVQQHKNGGMAQSAIEATDSWKLLVKHNAVPA